MEIYPLPRLVKVRNSEIASAFASIAQFRATIDAARREVTLTRELLTRIDLEFGVLD